MCEWQHSLLGSSPALVTATTTTERLGVAVPWVKARRKKEKNLVSSERGVCFLSASSRAAPSVSKDSK